MGKFKVFFKAFVNFFARNTSILATAAVIAEKATGNDELIKTTNDVASAVEAGAKALGKVE